ncbi:DeoR/GlpR family DNA-binding transcription regulator [Virgibacillus saliphilus]|uniref:DeoR/GlpR family DNA-binding transcription regulator n=1 Tax=Virgibacillus saliphilus TaxID=2831674 RepID=UPI002815F85D|nr:DeoR/GlpR family DNA-binding transcription regulator [Virgibacillus sp. NKC19-3]
MLQLIDDRDFLKVNEAAELLDVTEMTIRRDLVNLEKQGSIVRVHGGAKKIPEDEYIELSHKEKETLNVEEKKYVAKKAAELIKDKDIVFIGPGTTTEMIYDYIDVNTANIITNSISIFNRFQGDTRFEVILIGGRLRERTKTFVGYFTRNWIKDFKVQKTFIGTNGIYEEKITTADEEEGSIQQTILNNSKNNYVVSDSSKFGIEAFQVICPIQDVTAIVTDQQIPAKIEEFYKGKCKIIN